MSTPGSATFPPPEPFTPPTCNPGPLRPVETPAPDLILPSLPTPPRKSLLDEWYTLSRHLAPAASPRTTPFIPLPPLPQWSSDKEQFKASVQRTIDAVVGNKEAQWAGKLDHLPPNRKPLWNCVNRYVRKGLLPEDKKGVTLFCSHANGFPKETWEPTLERLVANHGTTANYQVDEIWLWEAANHGDSCLVNRENLCGIYDWRDNSRDILHFLLHYLPASTSPEPLPTHLSRLDETNSTARKVHGLPDRNMVYMGHSFGGATVVRAALEQPALFRSLYMLEAMIRPRRGTGPLTTDRIRQFIGGAVQRRDGWSSREEALKGFSASPFFQVWDPASLKIYVECGLYDAPDGQVKLKMAGVHEGICFAEAYASAETFELLDKLDERVEVRWLVAAKLTDEELEDRQQVVWRRPANSSHRIVPSGHLVAQEIPSELAHDLHDFLNSRYGFRKALL